jgi:hypothetical protein
VTGLQLASDGAIDQVMLRSKVGENRGNKAGKRFLGDARFGAEFLGRQRLDPRLCEQIKTELLRGEARDFFKAATRMTRDGD